MAVAGKITVDTEVRTAGWSAGIAKNEKEIKSFVDNVQKQFRNLTGGGGAGGFANSLLKATKGAADLATALRTGASVSETFGKIINDIPIVGQFKQAGEAIRELITGEQAARVEREKSAAHLKEMVTSYRDMALQAALLGKYGQEKAKQEAENKTNQALSKVGNEHSDLNHEIMKIEKLAKKKAEALEAVTGKQVSGLTPAEQADLQRKKDKLRELDAQKKLIEKQGAQELKDLQTDANQEQLEYVRAHEASIDAVKASMEEKALKRTGHALESAIVGIKAEAAARQKALDAELDETKLRGLSDSDRTARIAINQKEREQLAKNTAATIQTLTEESESRKVSVAKDNEEKLNEIRASGNIERLKLTDEAINAENERRGVAVRSHLAEIAEVNEEYRKQAAALQKSHDEDAERKNDKNDLTLIAQQKAALEERNQKLALITQKAADEAAKNQKEHLKEVRKLWEDVGTPQEKYLAAMEEINEEYAKYGDKALKQRQIEKLDKETLKNLEKETPDHAPKVELYGRTLGYAGIQSGGKQEDVAAKQLAEIKKQTEAEESEKQDRITMYQYFKNLATAAVQELSI